MSRPSEFSHARAASARRLPAATRARGIPGRLATETKSALKTTELFAYLLTVAGILLAAALIDTADGNGLDHFRADEAWLYISILTAAYLISRGLAKSGSHEPYWAEQDGPR